MTVNIKEFPGTPLKETDFEEGNVFFTRWTPRAEYAWDAGVAIGRYLAELKEGRIIGIRCRHCRRTVVPPRTVCEWCFEPMSEWVYLQDTGVVNTFSLCYVTWDMVRIKEPLIPAVIEIDGASPGMGILHLLGEVDPKEVKIGMRVKAVWKPAEEREGAITDIKYFKPE
ncbi:MAG TPA: Zn-ribbon domain-containing OB-fold protein [Anaerolineae bacterium]|nr:Zn-ribbon domain-containing OB-fold protein [Anaerolineae bacterium]